MTQYERMVAGLIYDPGDPEIVKEQIPFQDRLWEFNQLKPSQLAEKEKFMKEVFAECGENNYIELPMHANWGGHHVHMGNQVYAIQILPWSMTVTSISAIRSCSDLT